MKHEDDFDGLLKDALREVGEAEPRMGIEGRVLAGVRARARERKFGWWKWAAVVAMVVVVAFGMWRVKERSQMANIKLPNTTPHESKSLPQSASPEKIAEVMKGNGPGPVVAPRKPRLVTSKREERVESASKKVPLLARTPMTEQEKALVMLAQNDPKVLLQVESRRSEGPLEISKIDIEPIKINGEEQR